MALIHFAKIHQLNRTQWVSKPLEEIFDFFAKPSNLEILTPPWLNFHITDAPQKLQAGSLIRYQLRIHGVPVHWTTEITEWNPPFSFVDIQLVGPYKSWHHRHTFAAENNDTTIHDTVDYVLPFGPLGNLVNWILVSRDVKRIFDYRQQKIAGLFAG